MYLVKRIKEYIFHVPIGNSKNIEIHYFHPHAPEIKLIQDDENIYVF